MKTLTRLTLLSAVTAVLGAPALCVPPLSPSGAQVSGPSTAVASSTGSKVPQDQAQAALDFQNAKRHDVGVPPLQLSLIHI